jgi:hypothetical protein
MQYCTTCSQAINEVVIIQGLPYGTTCALNKLGLREFPSWFKFGDWDKAKLSNDELLEKNHIDFENTMLITNECWAEWCLLSKAHFEQRVFQDKWAEDFIYSISRQLGYGMFLDQIQFKNNTWVKGCPTISKIPKKITDLSPKQQLLLQKYLSY